MFLYINKILHNFVWGPGMLFFFCGCGIYLTLRTKFFQITKFKIWVKYTIGSLFVKGTPSKITDNNSISAFQTFTAALAGTLGTGNIVGVATALAAGGPGSIFWMWVSAIFGMMTGYGENVLGFLYRRKNKQGAWQGGPMYYLQYGLNAKWLAVIFALFATLASIGMGNMTQTNSIANALNSSFKVPPLFTGIVVGILLSLVACGGIKRIGRVTEKLIPTMAILYILGCIVILIKFNSNVPVAITQIFKSAFNFKSAVGGIGGYSILQAMRYGVSRGVFSNEAGLGSSVLIHTSGNIKSAPEQGMWSICEIFVDTIVMCTLTALTILSTGAFDMGYDGAALVVNAFELGLGGIGSLFLTIAITLFAFSTLLSWSYNGKLAFEYLFGYKLKHLYTIIFVFAVPFGCVMHLDIVWSLSDTCNGLMAIPNLIGVILLSDKIFKCTKDLLIKNSNK